MVSLRSPCALPSSLFPAHSEYSVPRFRTKQSSSRFVVLDCKSPEKKREIEDYNEALRVMFAEASLKLSDKEQCIVKREYLEEVGLCKAPRRPSSKRTRSKTAPSIVKVKQEE